MILEHGGLINIRGTADISIRAYTELLLDVVPVQSQVQGGPSLFGNGPGLAGSIPACLVDPMLRHAQFIHLPGDFFLLAQVRLRVVRILIDVDDTCG